MAYLLDTDHLSILQLQSRPGYERLSIRLRTIAPDDIQTTNISFHEQMQGWLALLQKSRTSAQVIIAYTELEEM